MIMKSDDLNSGEFIKDIRNLKLKFTKHEERRHTFDHLSKLLLRPMEGRVIHCIWYDSIPYTKGMS